MDMSQVPFTVENVEKVCKSQRTTQLSFFIYLRVQLLLGSERVLRHKSSDERVQATAGPVAQTGAEFARGMAVLVAAGRHEQVDQLSVLRRQLLVHKSGQVPERCAERSIRCAQE